jgi:hypothetical protein
MFLSGNEDNFAFALSSSKGMWFDKLTTNGM